MDKCLCIETLLCLFTPAQTAYLFYPSERRTTRSTEVKQAVRSTSVGWKMEWGWSPVPGSSCPPGRRQRSNISCSSVWPTASWGVTERGRTCEEICANTGDKMIWGLVLLLVAAATVEVKWVAFLFTRQVEVQSDNGASLWVDLTLVRASVLQAGRWDGVEHVHAGGDVFEKVHLLSFHLWFAEAKKELICKVISPFYFCCLGQLCIFSAFFIVIA